MPHHGLLGILSTREPGKPVILGLFNTLPINADHRLHTEILDFYEWVKPQPFEQHVRQDLITRLDRLFQKRYGNDVQIRPFGSFASGLYLPTADIDCVLLSRSFMISGQKSLGEKKSQVWAFAGFLRRSNMVLPGSVEAIPFARVPIIKFVDKLTGLRVDMSFDNDSGLVANDTFQQWKTQFPVMPVIVSVVKQFLLLRGLNEVPTGGLGGFAITCLVTSLLQHMPYDMNTRSVGSILLDFLNFYGNTFDTGSVGIRMKPPGYFNKVCHSDTLSRPDFSYVRYRSLVKETVLRSGIPTTRIMISRAGPGRSN